MADFARILPAGLSQSDVIRLCAGEFSFLGLERDGQAVHRPSQPKLIPAQIDLRAQGLSAGSRISVSFQKVIRAPVSRLVVDVERFEDDQQETMAGRGMGAVYCVTSSLKPLRLPLQAIERDHLIEAYYRPHHARLEAAVAAAVHAHGHCLVIDCHSFPSLALPYELADSTVARPDICIGTDVFHTSAGLANAFVSTFKREGWSVSLNDPFAGSLVPSGRYQKDRRVSGIMVEVNRGLYLNEYDGMPLPRFSEVASRIKNCCLVAVAASNPQGVVIGSSHG